MTEVIKRQHKLPVKWHAMRKQMCLDCQLNP
jgi:hypothetical protein